MELKIYSPQDAGFIQKIDWNFEELKTEISAVAQEYETSVYTDDTIGDAKADRAKLNKFKDALTGKRTEIRKKLLEPDELFGQQVKELTGIVQKAIDNIDGQVKGYEERKRNEKLDKVREFYEDNIQDLAEYLPWNRVVKPEYGNASKTMKSIKEEILALIQKVAEGIAILNEVDSPHAGDMKQVFLESYDIGAAMAERNRLEEDEKRRKIYAEQQAKLKAEREAKRQQETERVMSAGRQSMPEATAQPSQPQQGIPVTETVEDPVHVLDFRVYVTKSQMEQLKKFLNESGIRFEPVPKQ